MFVTHEINPILPLVDRVLYLVDGRFRVGTPDEVMTSATLSTLYRTDVDVLRVRGRLVVVGADARRTALPPRGGDVIERLFTFTGTGELLGQGFVQSALLAAALLGLVAGVLAPLIVARGMAFAVHGTAELAFTGGRRHCSPGSAWASVRWRGRSRRASCSACWGCGRASATR